MMLVCACWTGRVAVFVCSGCPFFQQPRGLAAAAAQPTPSVNSCRVVSPLPFFLSSCAVPRMPTGALSRLGGTLGTHVQNESMSLAGGGASGSGVMGSQSQLGSVTVSKLKRELEAAEKSKEE